MLRERRSEKRVIGLWLGDHCFLNPKGKRIIMMGFSFTVWTMVNGDGEGEVLIHTPYSKELSTWEYYRGTLFTWQFVLLGPSWLVKCDPQASFTQSIWSCFNILFCLVFELYLHSLCLSFCRFHIFFSHTQGIR